MRMFNSIIAFTKLQKKMSKDGCVCVCISHSSSRMHPNLTPTSIHLPQSLYSIPFLSVSISLADLLSAMSTIMITTINIWLLAFALVLRLLRRKSFMAITYVHTEFRRANRIKRLRKWLDDFVTYSIGVIVIIAITFDTQYKCVCVFVCMFVRYTLVAAVVSDIIVDTSLLGNSHFCSHLWSILLHKIIESFLQHHFPMMMFVLIQFIVCVYVCLVLATK